MIEFLQGQLDYIFFFYGLASVGMAVVRIKLSDKGNGHANSFNFLGCNSPVIGMIVAIAIQGRAKFQLDQGFLNPIHKA
jgi:hypothetical protein